jgi:hypothetical protein
MLLAVPQGGQAQDTFNSNSGAVPNMGAGQALRCAEERLKHYADEPFKQPSVCPQPTPSDATPGTSGGVLLKGGVGVEENGKRPGAAGIFEGGTLPPRTGAGVFGPQTPASSVLQGSTGAAGPGPGSAPVLKGGVSQGQQGTPGYPPPTATTQPASRQPVFVGSKEIDKKTYTIRSEGHPGGAAWGAFTNPDRYYEGFYGQVERRGSGYIFRVTVLRLPGGGTKAANIEVPVKKVQ